MLAFEIGDAVLLFPGDSQWGSWRVNRDDDRQMDLLRRCTFYKVGHHGSHNANPKFFLDDKRLVGLWGAAISVTPHGSYKRIPKPELIDHLLDKLAGGPIGPRLVRSDIPPAHDVPDGVDVATRSAWTSKYLSGPAVAELSFPMPLLTRVTGTVILSRVQNIGGPGSDQRENRPLSSIGSHRGVSCLGKQCCLYTAWVNSVLLTRWSRWRTR